MKLVLTERQCADLRAAHRASERQQAAVKAEIAEMDAQQFEVDRGNGVFARQRIERACREERQIDASQGRP